MADLTPVTIPRSKWLRGEGSMDSFLLRGRDGKMCCVGFMCLARGVPVDVLVGEKTVRELGDWMCGDEGSDVLFHPLYSINDVEEGRSLAAAAIDEILMAESLMDIAKAPMTPALRESEIIRRAKDLGFDVTFVD